MSTDIERPIFESISIDKKVVYPGDSITLTGFASDEVSTIREFTVCYEAPISKANRYATLKSVDDQYVGKMDITKNDENGIWKIRSISIYDDALNLTPIYNSDFYEVGEKPTTIDLSEQDFEVISNGRNTSKSDIVIPALISINVNKKIITCGEDVIVKLDAIGDLSDVGYLKVVYHAPSIKTANVSKNIKIWANSDNEFIGNMSTNEYDEVGIWEVDSISVMDKAGKLKYICNSKKIFCDASLKKSMGNFEMVLPK